MKCRSKTFVSYIRAINRGVLLATTVHHAVLFFEKEQQKDSAKELTAVRNGCEILGLWERLKTELGEEEAKRAVDEWLTLPYSLGRHGA